MSYVFIESRKVRNFFLERRWDGNEGEITPGKIKGILLKILSISE